MARIRTPKPLDSLLREVEPEKYIPLLGKYGATDSKGRYLHWNDFKWRMKRGDDELGAWVVTKFARQAIAQDLPLPAEGDFCFSYCIPNSLFAQLHTIDKMTGGGRKIGDGTFVSCYEKNRYLVKSLMQEEAITSSQLEGASTTRKVAKEMLRKNLAPKDKSQQMILNNYLLMQKAVENKDEELSIEFILELHRIATYNAIENQAASGELRKDNNIVVSDLYNENIFVPPDWQTIPDRLAKLCDFANWDSNQNDYGNFIHPIIKAIILHFMIAYIHPFGDGNGRTARAIFYWSILKSGYWLFEYVSISKLIQEKRSNYDNAFIYVETDNFDITYFLYNQVDTILKAVNSLYEYIDRKKRDFYEFRDWIDKSPVAKTLKIIQLEILKEALREPGREFTAKQVAMDFEVSQNTARSYLNALVEKDLLLSSQSKHGKTILYLAPASLRERLKLS
ncbi:MAG: Fic family protein [Calothrix sp. MO_167.B12]|nr:Fic family protein [Calothrix sp. MO_167.B12]